MQKSPKYSILHDPVPNVIAVDTKAYPLLCDNSRDRVVFINLLFGFLLLPWDVLSLHKETSCISSKAILKHLHSPYFGSIDKNTLCTCSQVFQSQSKPLSTPYWEILSLLSHYIVVRLSFLSNCIWYFISYSLTLLQRRHS